MDTRINPESHYARGNVKRDIGIPGDQQLRLRGFKFRSRLGVLPRYLSVLSFSEHYMQYCIVLDPDHVSNLQNLI